MTKIPEFPTAGLGVRLLRKAVNEKLEELERRADRVPRGCIASSREIRILKENAEEVYSKNSKQMKLIRRLEKRVCD